MAYIFITLTKIHNETHYVANDIKLSTWYFISFKTVVSVLSQLETTYSLSHTAFQSSQMTIP